MRRKLGAAAAPAKDFVIQELAVRAAPVLAGLMGIESTQGCTHRPL
jgi:hypothetical protein